MEEYKREWTRNIKTELISGIVVCMALIPEAIGFTIVAGVDPMVGVYSCFCMSVIISIFGGRTGMISAAAGSMACGPGRGQSRRAVFHRRKASADSVRAGAQYAGMRH